MFKTSVTISPLLARFAPLVFAGGWQEGIQTAKRLGYDAVELSLRDPQSPILSEVLAALEREGMPVSAIATGQSYLQDGLSLVNPDGSAQAELRRRVQRFIELAGTWGALVILGGVRGRFQGESETWAEQRARAVAMVREFAASAARLGVRLAIEPLNRYETNFLNSLQDGDVFCRETGAENVVLLADTFHMNIEEASLEASLEAFAPRLGYVHLVDSNRRAPGLGHLDLCSVLDTLRRAGYAGYLSAEVLPWPDPATAARLAIQYYTTH